MAGAKRRILRALASSTQLFEAEPIQRMADVSEQQIATVLEKGIPYRKQWKPGAETAVVRVLVRDKATGRLGALDVRYD